MSERKFRAMGTDCHLIVNTTDEQASTRLIELALARVELLEACWSRFRPLSELNRLNAQAGTGPKVVSEDLLALVAAMRAAWSATDGLFDPTILSSMHAIGYDVDFATMVARDAIAITQVRPAPGMGDVLINVVDHTVTFPAGVGIDPGAIGKGFAADIIDDIVARQTFVPTRTLYNPFFAQCDNLGTCWVAKPEMHGEFVIINGDTLFEAAILRRLLSTDVGAAVTLVTDSKASYDDDDMKVVVSDGRLRRVGKQLGSAAVNGESIGMMAFRREGPARFAAQLDYMMRHGTGLKQWYLAAVDQLADQALVATCAIDGLSWCEIDDSADLARAATVIANWYPARGVSAGTGG